MIYIYIYIYTYTHRGGERLSARSLQGGDFHGAAIINAYALYNPGDTITLCKRETMQFIYLSVVYFTTWKEISLAKFAILPWQLLGWD